ncbi:MAG TPA: protein kinase [Gemmataceae bacterium]|jgi:serine/threonine protein kinase|nr:protein kinase [Gemmataceae bacterium]
MPLTSASALLEMLRAYGLLDSEHLEDLGRSHSTYYPTAQTLAKELVRRGWLTVYQVNQLLQDSGQDLIVGPYVLLDRLGQGGVSQVFKAYHPKSGRLLALKVIRPELLSNPEALGRFHREMRAVAQLNHPNIVNGFNISLDGDRNFFGMEFVDGTDLRKLVELAGALPVPQACDYMRQAALGLQHAHEHGLIHRDIKPANLLLSAAGSRIKILDMGLALFKDTAEEVLTRAPIGSADYLAPEQAQDSHRVDIRADIYSLGCTFYYLLTANAPFADARSAAQKLIAHCSRQAKPVRALRPEVPAEVAAVIDKTLAKDPAQRYQTPAEVAEALAAWELKPAPGPSELQPSSGAPAAYVNPKTTRVVRRPVLPPAPLKETRPLRRPVPATVSAGAPALSLGPAGAAGEEKKVSGPFLSTKRVLTPFFLRADCPPDDVPPARPLEPRTAPAVPSAAVASTGPAGVSGVQGYRWAFWLVVALTGLACVATGLILRQY